MAAGVGERLLNGPHQREHRLRGERSRDALDRQPAVTALFTMRLEQCGQAVLQRRRVGAQRRHRAARLLEPLPRRPPTGADPLERALEVATLGEQHLRRLELDGQPAERVCEHVVDLARDARALVERRGPSARRLGLSGLGAERVGGAGLGGVLTTREPDERGSEQDRRIAERRARAEAGPQDTCLECDERDPRDRDRLEHRAIGDGLDDGDRRERERGAAVLQGRQQAAGERYEPQRRRP